MTIKSYLKTAEKFTLDNSSTILTTVGVVGTVSTAVLTGRASVKAHHILQHEHQDMDYVFDKKDIKQVIGLTWKCYIPPVLVGTTTIASIIMANRVSSKRAAAVAAAYALSEKAYSEYKDKVTHIIGEKKEEEIRAEVASEQIRKDAPSSTLIVADNKVLCREAYSGRYFTSTMEDLKKAQNDLNYQVLNYGYASLNDYYDNLGLPNTDVGEEMGWHADNIMEAEYTTVMSEDQRPCINITFRVQPGRGYFKTR